MIKKEDMKLVSIKEIALDSFEMILENKYISQTAKPGQFLHIHVLGYTLRRPISIANVDTLNNTVTVLFKVVGSGTKQLSLCQPGMMIDVLGPNGNGFTLNNPVNSKILLIGGGIGVPPLYYLGKTLQKQGMEITSILGFQTKESVFYEEEFKALGKTYITTDDGSYGHEGFVTDIAKDLTSIDCYYSCGPVPMLRAVTNVLDGHKGYISLEERMGCGIGACFACVIPSNIEPNGYKKICQDGPVFAANEVLL